MPEPLLHPERVAADAIVGARAEPDELEQFRDLRGVVAGRRRQHGEVLRAGEPRVEGRALDQRADASEVGRGVDKRPAEHRPAPAVGVTRPSSIAIVVVLPAPLGPTNPATTPAGTSIVRLLDGRALAVALGQTAQAHRGRASAACRGHPVTSCKRRCRHRGASFVVVARRLSVSAPTTSPPAPRASSAAGRFAAPTIWTRLVLRGRPASPVRARARGPPAATVGRTARLRDPRLYDALLAVALTTALQLQLALGDHPGDALLNAVGGLLLTLPLAARRRAPLAVAGVFTATAALNALLGGGLFDGQPPPFACLIAGAVMFYSLGAHAEDRPRWPAPRSASPGCGSP